MFIHPTLGTPYVPRKSLELKGLVAKIINQIKIIRIHGNYILAGGG